MNYPLVSICIPTFNGDRFIAEAMDSAIIQTYPHLEIVVSDDASTDSTLVIIESYRERTKIPIHIYPHQPQGIGANWNHCIQNAKGIYIKFLFQDDVFHPSCIEEMVQVLEDNITISLVASKRKLIFDRDFSNEEVSRWSDLYGDLQKSLTLEALDNKLFVIDKGLFKSSKFFSAPLNKVGEPTAVLIRKSIFKKVGFFREDLKQILDYEFFYRILKYNKILIIDKELVRFRKHKNQASFINKGITENKDYFQNEVYSKFALLLPKSIVFKHYRQKLKFFFK